MTEETEYAAVPISASNGKTYDVYFMNREDGGLRVWSEDMPGLILSGSDPTKVLMCVSPALNRLAEHKG